MNSKITYRKQFTRCGKERCRKCRDGEGHGPYWYAYWSEKGRTVSKYIGSHLPPDAEMTRHTQHARHEKLQQGAFEDEGENGKIETHASTQQPAIRVYMLGLFRVERKHEGEWKQVDDPIWRRRRARALLACLLSHPGRRLGREQVMELLWPDLEIEVASNRLNGAVHELRQILEPDIARPATSSMLRLERDVLELADGGQIWVDAEAFEQRLKEANALTDPAQIEEVLEEAASLYVGNYLMDEMYSEWAAPRRDGLQRSWVGLMLKLANVQVERGMFANAIETLEALHATDRTNETGLQRMMLLLTQLDRRGEALQLYRKHVAYMQREHESEPLPETRKLYETLHQGHTPTTFVIKPPPAPPASPPARPVEPAPVAPPTLPPSAMPEITFSRPVLQLGRHLKSPLVGRKRELDIMQQLLLSIEEIQSARAMDAELVQRLPAAPDIVAPKRPHFLVLMGEPGIGKTRLAEELSIEAYTHGWSVVWSRAYEQEGTIPYRPWIELLRTLLRGVSAQLEAINASEHHPHPLQLRLERLGALLPDLAIYPPAPSHSSEQERLRLWEATLGLLESLSRARPLLLVLDDMHWIDDSSIELLIYLTHHLQDQRVLLAGTCRDIELGPVHKLRTLIYDLRREQMVISLPIQPLTESQIGTLVAHLPENLVQSVQTQASGNPFFAEELARSIAGDDDEIHALLPAASNDPASRQYTSRSSSRQRGGQEARSQRLLPEAIAAVLERRLSRLNNECQTLLGKAAVLGGSFELRQLLLMTGEQFEDAAYDLLEEATGAGLLNEEGTGAHITYHFSHPLIVSHLYERLSAARRAQLHRKAADAILASHPSSPEKVAADVVNHLNRGGGDLKQIAHYAELAGNHAYELAAYAEVQYYYLLAIQALVGAALPSFGAADSRAQIQHITPTIIATLPSSSPNSVMLLHICRILERIAECSMAQGNFEDGRHLYTCILAIRTGEAFRQQMYAEGGEHETRARQEAQIQALLWRELGKTWVETSDYQRAHECYGHGTETLAKAGVTKGTAWACLHLQYGEMHRLVGNFHEARRYLMDALSMLEQSMQQTAPSPARYAVLQQDTAEDASVPLEALVEKRLPQVHSAKEVRTRTERALVGDPLEVGYAHERLGIVAASLGQLSDALDHMHTALNIYEQNELVLEMIRVTGNLGAVYITQGELASARTYLHRARDLAERTGMLPNMTFITGNLADVAQRTGDLLESEAWFKRTVALSEQLHDRHRICWFNIELASVQQDLGHVREAAESIRRALVLARALKNPRHTRFALVVLGDLRIMQAIMAYYLQPQDIRTNGQSPSSGYQRLLRRAKATLLHALSLKGLEIEPMIEGKLLLAMVYYLLNEQETAKEMALQTLLEAQEQETTRVIGRTQRLLGRIMADQGNDAEADAYFKQAIELCCACELRLDHARSLHSYGLALVNRGKASASNPQKVVQLKSQQRGWQSYEQGLNYLHKARDIFAASHAAYDLMLVEQTLAYLEHLQSSIAQ